MRLTFTEIIHMKHFRLAGAGYKDSIDFAIPINVTEKIKKTE